MDPAYDVDRSLIDSLPEEVTREILSYLGAVDAHRYGMANRKLGR